MLVIIVAPLRLTFWVLVIGWGSIPRGQGILEHPPPIVAPLTR